MLCLPSPQADPSACVRPLPESPGLQRLVGLEKRAAGSAGDGGKDKAQAPRRPRSPLVLYQAPRRAAAPEGGAEAAAA